MPDASPERMMIPGVPCIETLNRNTEGKYAPTFICDLYPYAPAAPFWHRATRAFLIWVCRFSWHGMVHGSNKDLMHYRRGLGDRFDVLECEVCVWCGTWRLRYNEKKS